MKRLTTVFLLVLPMVVVACTSPVVSTIAPTASPTFEQLPTETIEPTPQPSPTPPQIPVPYTIITPTRVVTLAVTEITGTVSTRGKAAIVWLADGVRHFGILDIENASVSQLPFSLEDNYKQSGGVVWSPTGTAFVYEQHVVYSVDGTLYDYDIFGVRTDSLNDGKALDENIYYFNECTWSPDGQYVSCSFNASHASGGGWCAKVYDASTWEARCAVGMVLSCNIYQPSYCKALPLRSGEFWDPSISSPDIVRLTPRPTEMTRSDVQIALDQMCRNAPYCAVKANSDNRFIAYFVWALRQTVVFDRQQNQVWGLGNIISYRSWSVGNSYFSWIDDQLSLFDTADHTATTYLLPGAKILNVTWAPLK